MSFRLDEELRRIGDYAELGLELSCQEVDDDHVPLQAWLEEPANMQRHIEALKAEVPARVAAHDAAVTGAALGVAPMIALALGRSAWIPAALHTSLRTDERGRVVAVTSRPQSSRSTDPLDIGRGAIAVAHDWIERIRKTTTVGRRGLWSMLSSTWALAVTGADPTAGGDALAVALTSSVPLRAAPRLVRVRPAGTDGLAVVRAACCLNHLRPDADRCAVSCPLDNDDERRVSLIRRCQ